MTPLFALLLGIGACVPLFLSRGEERRTALVWLLFPAAYLLFLLSWKVICTHYLMPVFPLLILLGLHGWERLGERTGKPWIVPAAAIVLCIPLVHTVVAMDRLLVRRDTRLAAHEWIVENLPRGSTILRLPHTPEFTRNDPFSVRVDWEGKLIGTPAGTLSREYGYIVTSSFNNTALSPWENELLSCYVPVKEWPHIPLAMFHHPRIIVYQRKDL